MAASADPDDAPRDLGGRDDGSRLRQLRAFVGVAEQGSVSAAAAELGVAQPAMSRLLMRLEQRLAVKLFDRTSTGSVLTPAGATLLPEARRVLDAVQAFDVAANAAVSGRSGLLRIGSTEGAGPITTEILRLFRARHPGVRVRLQQGHTPAKLAALRRGRLDIAFVRNPVATPGIRTEEILCEPLLAVLATDHPLHDRPAVTLAELSGYPLLLTPPHINRGVHDAVLALLARAGPLPRTTTPLTGEADGLALVATSDHWMLLSRSTTGAVNAPVVALPIQGSEARVAIHLAWRENADLQSPAVSAFRRAAADAGRGSATRNTATRPP